MTLDQLYEIAASQGIEIDEIEMRALRAVSFPEGWIAVDRRKFASETEFKCVLAHEIGHFKTGLFYNINTDRHEKELIEYYANRAAAELLVPLSELKKAFQRGILFNQILARMFDVTLEFINMVMEVFEYELSAAARIRPPRYEMTESVKQGLLSVFRAVQDHREVIT